MRCATFPSAQVSGEGPALGAAGDYAAQHALAYDNVRVLLRLRPDSPDFRWRVQLMDGADSKGFVFVSATDGTFALYSPPGSVPVKTRSNTGGGVVGDANVRPTT